MNVHMPCVVQGVMDTRIDSILRSNLGTYAEVLIGNCEAKVIGNGAGESLEVRLEIRGMDDVFQFKRRGYYDSEALMDVAHHWIQWLQEGGLSSQSSIPTLLTKGWHYLDILLVLNPGVDFLEQAKLLLHPLSPVHNQERFTID